MSFANYKPLKSWISGEINRSRKWLSHDIENELIGIMGELVIIQIVEKIKKCNFYGIMTDETTDNYNIEQACLSIRYVDPKTYDIYEDFVDIYLSICSIQHNRGGTL